MFNKKVSVEKLAEDLIEYFNILITHPSPDGLQYQNVSKMDIKSFTAGASAALMSLQQYTEDEMQKVCEIVIYALRKKFNLLKN